MKFTSVRRLCLCIPLLVTSPLAQAEDWPTFRGSDRSGISTETGLIDSFPADGPKLLFTAKGAGRGYASPAIADGKMFTLGDNLSTASDKNEYLTCFDVATGKQLWARRTGPAWNNGPASWQGSRGTPTVDGNLVYVITPFGKLIAANVANGRVVWSHDLKDDFGGKKADSWGYSESPLVDGNRLVCTPGGKQATVVALNKKTGRPIWKCARPNDTGAGHSSIVISHLGNRDVYVQNTACGPMGVDPATGRLLWEFYIQPPTAFIPSPIVDGNYVFTVAGYGTGSALLEQTVGPRGGVSIEKVYGLNTEVSSKHGGVVLIDGNLYFGKEDQNTLVCADMKTGKVAWKSRGKGRDSMAVTAADGKLIFRSQSGVVSMVAADPSGYKLQGSFSTPNAGGRDQPSWAHPVISGKRLYLRESDQIHVYDMAQ